MRKSKEIMQNALNIANMIAFNSHKTKEYKRCFITPNKTPGPGTYDEIKESPRRVNHPLVLKDEDRSKWMKENNSKEKLGPGNYYKDSVWITPSYNVTMPNNIIYKRREKIIKEKLENLANH